ncbi:MAG TPA: DNA polymerase III subunit delta [Rhodospirillaceae bacterium]|nr:DNA polymerase III subunit delta [Candidatus Neomarinimicrobiota bacterium]HCX14344.1 DNA polymerase III subunit delta [Rhodospirillaceae bacterium]
MKIPPGRADAFSANPDSGVRSILVYGPDAGLVRERLNILTRSVADSIDDPFRVSEFSADQLRDDPARLRDEAAGLALTGGRRVVRIRDATDKTADLFAKFLENPVGDALVLVDSRDLGPRSKLRTVFEKANDAAALACYSDDTQSLEAIIRSSLKAAGLQIAPEALGWLTSHLGGDREQSRSEIEKLIVYMGPDAAARNTVITEDDILACVGDNAAIGLDNLTYAVCEGDQAMVRRAYGLMIAEAVSPISILTSVSRHFMRLYETRGHLKDGKNIDEAASRLRPPVFFKYKRRFQIQAGRWSEDLLIRGLELLMKAELSAKSTDMPTIAVVERTLIQLAQVGRRAARR